jgi:uncharacterized protein YegP (UPF0339 family)
MIRRFASFAMLALALSSTALVGCDAEDDGTSDEQDVSSAKAGTFETFVGIDGKHYFHLLSPNGEKVLQSQAYSSRSGAEKGVESVRKNAVDAKNFDQLTASNGEHYFNLVAQNGEIIGSSELYTTASSAKKAITSVTSLVAKAQRQRAAEEGGARFTTVKGADGKTYFNLRAKNGEIMLQSQGYSSKSKALDGIDSVRDNAKVDEAYEIVTLEDGGAFFRVVAGNGEIIARSEIYVSESNAERGYETVRDLIASELVADPK